MDLDRGAVLGDEGVPDGRMGAEDGGDVAGPVEGCHNVIRNTQQDGHNHGGFLYSD